MSDIEDEVNNLSAEFEKCMEEAAKRTEAAGGGAPTTPAVNEEEEIYIPEPPPDNSELQARYDYIVAANRRNIHRIRHLLDLLTTMGENAAKLGLKFNEMGALV